MNYLIKTVVFFLFVVIYVPPIILDSKCYWFDSDNLLRFTKMVKCLPEFEYFYCILENRNFISNIRRSKVTDYAALKRLSLQL